MSTKEIILDTPIKRGETTLTKIILSKPPSGSLRGVSIRAILDMDVDTIETVVPRISDPKLTPAEAAGLEPPDKMQMGVALASFFMPKSALVEAESQNQSRTT